MLRAQAPKSSPKPRSWVGLERAIHFMSPEGEASSPSLANKREFGRPTVLRNPWFAQSSEKESGCMQSGPVQLAHAALGAEGAVNSSAG
jgi:hypothetical protein